MLDYMKIRDIIYKYPDLNDNEIAEKLIKDNPDNFGFLSKRYN